MKKKYTNSKKKRDKARRDMPTQSAILNRWKKYLFENYNREIHTFSTCFGCLREGYVQRCHIEPLQMGGVNKAKNLHLLCPNCHVESEGYRGRFYWIWFENKDIVFLPIYRSLEKANLIVKIGELLSKEMPRKYQEVINGNNVEKMLKLYYQFLEDVGIIPNDSDGKQNKLF